MVISSGPVPAALSPCCTGHWPTRPTSARCHVHAGRSSAARSRQSPPRRPAAPSWPSAGRGNPATPATGITGPGGNGQPHHLVTELALSCSASSGRRGQGRTGCARTGQSRHPLSAACSGALRWASDSCASFRWGRAPSLDTRLHARSRSPAPAGGRHCGPRWLFWIRTASDAAPDLRRANLFEDAAAGKQQPRCRGQRGQPG